MPRTFTTEDFKTKGKVVHNNVYDYSCSVYTGYHKNIDIKCRIHGVFKQTPGNHLQGKGCPRCGIEEKAKKRRKSTTGDFIRKARIIHHKKYDYNLSVFKSVNKRIKIICPIHGVFEQTPYCHIIKKNGCPTCGRKTGGVTKTTSFRDFLNRARRIHGNKYQYDKDHYKNLGKSMEIFCSVCGHTFFQKGEKHLKGQGCPICANKHRAQLKIKGKDKFIVQAREIHGNRHDYSKVIYTRSNVPVCITCKKHGDFFQSPNSHLSGSGCPKCTQSKGEKIIENYLINHQIKYKYHKVFKNCRNIKPLIYDFYLSSYNVCIEFDGQQHFKPAGWFGSEDPLKKLKRTRKNDRIKNLFCKNEKIGLIRISYLKMKKINQILDKFFRCDQSMIGDVLCKKEKAKKI